jgi:hypothetical protein
MTLDEKSATCIALIAVASEANANLLLNLLHGEARDLGHAIISAKQNRNYRGRFHTRAKAILDLVDSNQKKIAQYQADRNEACHPHTECAAA